LFFTHTSSWTSSAYRSWRGLGGASTPKRATSSAHHVICAVDAAVSTATARHAHDETRTPGKPWIHPFRLGGAVADFGEEEGLGRSTYRTPRSRPGTSSCRRTSRRGRACSPCSRSPPPGSTTTCRSSPPGDHCHSP